MSSNPYLTLTELQSIAEKAAERYFMVERMICLHSTLHAIQEAMKEIDDINYIHPIIIKASNGILAGLWSSHGPCGIVLAGAMSLSLKYGTADPKEAKTILLAGLKSRDWYYWFKEEFGSCDCIDISEVEDWSSSESMVWYREHKHDLCKTIMMRSVRKIVDLLTK